MKKIITAAIVAVSFASAAEARSNLPACYYLAKSKGYSTIEAQNAFNRACRDQLFREAGNFAHFDDKKLPVTPESEWAPK